MYSYTWLYELVIVVNAVTLVCIAVHTDLGPGDGTSKSAQTVFSFFISGCLFTFHRDVD